MEQTIRNYTNVKLGFIIQDDMTNIESIFDMGSNEHILNHYNNHKDKGGLHFEPCVESFIQILNTEDFCDIVKEVYYTDIKEDGTLEYKPKVAKKVWVEIYTDGEYEPSRFDNSKMWKDFLDVTGCPYTHVEDLYSAIKDGKVTYEQIDKWHNLDNTGVIYIYTDPTDIKQSNCESFVVEINYEYYFFQGDADKKKQEVIDAFNSFFNDDNEAKPSSAEAEKSEPLPAPPSEVHVEVETSESRLKPKPKPQPQLNYCKFDLRDMLSKIDDLCDSETCYRLTFSNGDELYLSIMCDKYEDNMSYRAYDDDGKLVYKSWHYGTSLDDIINDFGDIEFNKCSHYSNVLPMSTSVFHHYLGI